MAKIPSLNRKPIKYKLRQPIAHIKVITRW